MHPDLAARDVRRLPRIHAATRPTAWQDWSARTGIRIDGPETVFQHFYLSLQAAEAGQGLAIASLHMVAEAVATGRLHAPFAFSPDGTSYLAVTSSDAPTRTDEAIIAWLRDRMMQVAGSA